MFKKFTLYGMLFSVSISSTLYADVPCEDCTVTGRNAAAFGQNSIATGNNSAAFGTSSEARGPSSVTFGWLNSATGHNTSAFGWSTAANAFASTVVGRLNLSYPDVGSTSPNVNDPLFVVGNGINTNQRSNAFTVFGDGIAEVYGDLIVHGGILRPSDDTLKTSVTSTTAGLEELMELSPISYTLIDHEEHSRLGFITQDVELVLPGLVRETRDGQKAIDQSGILALLVSAVRELKQQNDALKSAYCEEISHKPICRN
jgi:Chaperone of endosialidase